MVAGYNVALGKGSKIKFSRNYDSHTLTVDSIGTNFAGITIASSPISFALMNGESREIDFDSDEHNDLLVKLESIEGSKANITLKSIYEKIAEENFPLPEQTKSEQHAYTIQEKTETWSKTNLDNFTIKLSLIAGMIVAVTVLFWYFHKQYNQSIKLHLHTHIFHKRQK